MNHIIAIKDNKPYDNFTNQLFDSLILNEIPIKPPKELITDILTILFNIHDKITTNNVNTYIIHKVNDIKYCLFTYHSETKSNNDTIISRLIDNSYQSSYEPDICLKHDDIGVICKIDDEEVLDITKEEVMEIIKNTFEVRGLIISDNDITNHYYRNNPVFKLDGFDIYTTFKFNDNQLMIFLDSPEYIEFVDYDNVNCKNKDLMIKILNKWKVFKTTNKYPKNCKFLISLHNYNVNISITKEIEENIMKFLLE